MKIFYDYQIFSFQNYGGISRYFFELMDNIRKLGLVDFELSIKYSDNYYLKESDFLTADSFLQKVNFYAKPFIKNYLNQKNCIRDIKSEKFDLLHPTYYNPYFLKHIKNTKYVLTIYDMIHEIFVQNYRNGDKTREYKKVLAQNAARIIAISENTKNDIIRYFGIDDRKIDVIYLSSSLSSGSKAAHLDVPGRYLLYVGDRTVYKNFKKFLSAIHPLLIDDDDLFLICSGSSPFTAEEKELFKELKVEGKILKYPADNNTLAYLYHHAQAFVFPSLYEGFGIPILESMQCGCPTILSNTSSFSEVGGEAAVYFDPTDEASIKSNVEAVLYNEGARTRLRNEGYKNIKRFSWEDTTRKTVKVYESCL